MEAAEDPEAGEIVCILDALDECEESEGKALFEKLGSFYLARQKANAKLKLLITSRPYADIKGYFRYVVHDLPLINLRGAEESETVSEEINLVIMIRFQGLPAPGIPRSTKRLRTA
jgi:ankyrin repeat domain-containing protein 50